jgi:predicted Rdx family selenoprotein
MATEFYATGGTDVAIALTPGDSGVLTVDVDGDRIFDKASEGGHPDLNRVKELKAIVKEKLAVGVAAD